MEHDMESKLGLYMRLIQAKKRALVTPTPQIRGRSNYHMIIPDSSNWASRQLTFRYQACRKNSPNKRGSKWKCVAHIVSLYTYTYIYICVRSFNKALESLPKPEGPS